MTLIISSHIGVNAVMGKRVFSNKLEIQALTDFVNLRTRLSSKHFS